MQADTIARAGPPLLEVRDLQTTFDLSKTLSVCAVDGVSFTVDAGETLAEQAYRCLKQQLPTSIRLRPLSCSLQT